MKAKQERNIQQEKGLYQGGWMVALAVLMLKAAAVWGKFSFSMPPCLIHKWTGYYCPGCGGTRAFKELLKGHFWTSFCYHPVVLYGGILYAWFMISHTVEYLSRGKLNIGMKYTDRYLSIAVGIILVQWVLKNIVKIIWGIGPA